MGHSVTIAKESNVKFHIHYNEFDEPLAHVEMTVFDALHVSSALHAAITKRIEWLGEQKDSKYKEDRLRAFSDLASVSGAFDLIQETLWPMHEEFLQRVECDCCDVEEDDDAV